MFVCYPVNKHFIVTLLLSSRGTTVIKFSLSITGSCSVRVWPGSRAQQEVGYESSHEEMKKCLRVRGKTACICHPRAPTRQPLPSAAAAVLVRVDQAKVLMFAEVKVISQTREMSG